MFIIDFSPTIIILIYVKIISPYLTISTHKSIQNTFSSHASRDENCVK